MGDAKHNDCAYPRCSTHGRSVSALEASRRTVGVTQFLLSLKSPLLQGSRFFFLFCESVGGGGGKHEII
jgi:hypothetical protein